MLERSERRKERNKNGELRRREPKRESREGRTWRWMTEEGILRKS